MLRWRLGDKKPPMPVYLWGSAMKLIVRLLGWVFSFISCWSSNELSNDLSRLNVSLLLLIGKFIVWPHWETPQRQASPFVIIRDGYREKSDILPGVNWPDLAVVYSLLVKGRRDQRTQRTYKVETLSFVIFVVFRGKCVSDALKLTISEYWSYPAIVDTRLSE